MKNKIIYILYISAIMLILLIPLVGMGFVSSDTNDAEKRELASWPSIRQEDGSINKNILNNMGTYFKDHFAFRDTMIAGNALMKSLTVKSNPSDKVIIGKNGWLYYGGSMDDYLGKDLLSERELYSAVHNLSLMKDYAEKRDARFVVTIAPNKNSLYDQNMPINYIKSKNSNAKNIETLLHKKGIEYVNLFDAFEENDDVLYLKRDSHWNNKGAVLAYNHILDSLNINHQTYSNVTWETREDYDGDIDEMLFIDYHKKDVQLYPDVKYEYKNDNQIVDNMDSWIETSKEGKDYTLLMYRDSFAESLIPFFSEEFGKAYYSRLVPYNLTNIDEYKPDYVIVEKVERSIIDFVVRAPLFQAPVVNTLDTKTIETDTTIEFAEDGPFTVISGEIEEKFIENETDIYVSVINKDTGKETMFNASYLSSEERTGNKYVAYIYTKSLPQGKLEAKITVKNGSEDAYSVAIKDIEIKQEEKNEGK